MSIEIFANYFNFINKYYANYRIKNEEFLVQENQSQGRNRVVKKHK